MTPEPFHRPMLLIAPSSHLKRVLASDRLALLGWVCTSLLFFAGCQSEYDRLTAEQRASVRTKLEAVDRCLNQVPDQPTVPRTYDEWVLATERLNEIKSIANSDSVDPELASQVKGMQEEASAAVEAAFEKVKIDPPSPVVFGDTENANASVLLLKADGNHELDQEFGERNANEGRWYVVAETPDDIDWTKKKYRIVRALEYLLVLRQVDIREPEFVGRDDEDRPEYKTGAIECEAFLFRLADEQVIDSFRFIAATQSSALSVGPFELFLPDDTEAAVDIFRSRLFTSAREFAIAIAAELSPEITGPQRIVRDYLGTRLEWNEP